MALHPPPPGPADAAPSRLLSLAVAAAMFLSACEWDPMGTDGPRSVDPDTDGLEGGNGESGSSLTLHGTNGTLEIASLWLTLYELELEGKGDTDDFEVGPALVELPLGDGSVVSLSAPVPAGRYEEIEIEFEPVGDDDFLEHVRERFPEWPEDASMRVSGAFTPEADPSPIRFETYVEAEIEIEREPGSSLEVDDSASGTEIAAVDLAFWFKRGDGSVVDLAQWDYERSDGEIPELEVEIENGHVEVEWD